MATRKTLYQGTVTTLTSSTNQVAIDAAVDQQFKLNDLAEDTEIQIPTNGTDGDNFVLTIENTGGNAVTFAAGWVNIGQLLVSSDAGRVSVVSAVCRDFGAGLEWSYAVSHAETVNGITDLDATLQTANATPTAIAVFSTTTDDAAYLLDVSTVGIDKTADHVYDRAFRALVLRNGTSTLTVKNVSYYVTYNTDDPSWDVTVSVAGQNIIVNVTGDATNAVDWRIKGIVKEVA